MTSISIDQAIEQARAHQAAGRFTDAVRFFDLALPAAPRDARLRHDLARALAACGQLPRAVAECRQALAIASDYCDAWLTLGNLLRAQGKSMESIQVFRQAVALFPQRADAYINLGAALAESRQFADAAPLLRAAVQLQPGSPQAHHNLGTVLAELRQLDEAADSLRRALALRPGYQKTIYLLANVLCLAGKFEESALLCWQSIALRPDDPQAHLTLGTNLSALRQYDQAIAAYCQALALKPNWAAAHASLAGVQVECGLIAEAIRNYRRAIQFDPAFVGHFSSLLLNMNYQISVTPREIFQEHWLFNLTHAAELERREVVHLNDRSADRRLRIGYVSPDFREHTGSYFILPLLRNHDARRVEIYCYSDLRREDAVTGLFRAGADVWRRIDGLGDEQAADTIRADRIDILVDLALHSFGGRPLLFARRPAPIQVTWLGYPGTTGLTAMNYRLTDAYIDPPPGDAGCNDAWYFEESIRLPDTAICYDPRATEPHVNPLPATATGRVTFGCLNRFNKFNELTLRMWADVLSAAPGSRLLMPAPAGSPRERTLAFFQAAGIGADRIEFFERQPTWREMMETYHRIDIALGAFPWNGHTTSFEALWMGVPVVSLSGQRAISRAGLCYLSILNLKELATDTPERYVQAAVQLASDLPRLAGLRATLRDRLMNSPLTDAKRFAQNVEAAYLQMWKRWIEPPAPAIRGKTIS